MLAKANIMVGPFEDSNLKRVLFVGFTSGHWYTYLRSIFMFEIGY
jgi:hypothetical protein